MLRMGEGVMIFGRTSNKGVLSFRKGDFLACLLKMCKSALSSILFCIEKVSD